jgi:hypothetical protein
MSRGKRHDPPPAPHTLEEQIEEIHERLVRDRHSELYGLLDLLGNRRRMMWLNFTSGMARGAGFFIGVTMVGALLLSGLALAFNAAASHLGYKDLTLEQAVRAAVKKFDEVKTIVEKTQEETAAEARLEEQDAPVQRPDPLAPPPEHTALPPQPEPPR